MIMSMKFHEILIYMSKMVVNKKDEDTPEEVRLAKNFKLKKFSEAFHNFENKKDTMLEDDSNLERKITICQGTEEMLTLCHIPNNVKQKVSKVQTAPDKFLQRNKPLILNVSKF